MAQSLSKVYVHITFSTKNRYPFIDKNIENELWAYIGGICKNLECNPLRVGGQSRPRSYLLPFIEKDNADKIIGVALRY
jgi:REP element-mobilizing transposase RayT